MCLYPKLIKNRKYTITKKNKGVIPVAKDARVLLVPVGCGKCIECCKQKSNAWKVRLQEEVRNDNKGKFVTLTFSEESLIEITNRVLKEDTTIEGYELDNEIATKAVRLYLERWRKKHGKSVKHWLITELGHAGSERLHLHGLIWSDNIEDIKTIWKYGHVYTGKYVNEKTINYIAKYITKRDKEHPNYKGRILNSKGIGEGYTKREDAKKNKYREKEETNQLYRTRNGNKIAMPVYYRNKIYTEEEREKLWIEMLDKNERYVLGQKIDRSKGDEAYYKTLEEGAK